MTPETGLTKTPCTPGEYCTDDMPCEAHQAERESETRLTVAAPWHSDGESIWDVDNRWVADFHNEVEDNPREAINKALLLAAPNLLAALEAVADARDHGENLDTDQVAAIYAAIAEARGTTYIPQE